MTSQAGRADWRIVALGCALWLAATVVTWPIGPTFRDEVGYIGQSRLELHGAMHPGPDAVCYSFVTSHGEIPAYPPFLPTILIPLVAISPRAAFLLGVVSALLLTLQTARTLDRWGVRPYWSLALLLHPTVTVLSRTAMGDVLLTAAAVGAWSSLERSRGWRTAAWFGLLVAVKPTGILLAAGLIGGSWLRMRTAGLDRTDSNVRAASAGAAVGLVVTAMLNVAATGDPQYATIHSSARFGASFIAATGWRHVMTLLVLPPALLFGALPLWKRREYGALAAAVALLAVMAAYYYVDSGRTALESLVVAPRLILPSVAILLAGWVDGVGRWVPQRRQTLAAGVLLFGCFAAPSGIGFAHRRLQEPMRAALSRAEAQLSSQESQVLGVSESAFKAGVMAHSPIVAVTLGVPRSVSVILCSVEGESYRSGPRAVACGFDGFTEAASEGPYRVLVRNQ